MSEPRNSSVTISISGVWLTGWLFAIGYADLSFWRGVFALVAWPYFVGGAAR